MNDDIYSPGEQLDHKGPPLPTLLVLIGGVNKVTSYHPRGYHTCKPWAMSVASKSATTFNIFLTYRGYLLVVSMPGVLQSM